MGGEPIEPVEAHFGGRNGGADGTIGIRPLFQWQSAAAITATGGSPPDRPETGIQDRWESGIPEPDESDPGS